MADPQAQVRAAPVMVSAALYGAAMPGLPCGEPRTQAALPGFGQTRAWDLAGAAR